METRLQRFYALSINFGGGGVVEGGRKRRNISQSLGVRMYEIYNMYNT